MIKFYKHSNKLVRGHIDLDEERNKKKLKIYKIQRKPKEWMENKS